MQNDRNTLNLINITFRPQRLVHTNRNRTQKRNQFYSHSIWMNSYPICSIEFSRFKFSFFICTVLWNRLMIFYKRKDKKLHHIEMYGNNCQLCAYHKKLEQQMLCSGDMKNGGLQISWFLYYTSLLLLMSFGFNQCEITLTENLFHYSIHAYCSNPGLQYSFV